MQIFDGKYMDSTDKESDEYIKINSAGIQNLSSDCTVIRENGRKDYHILLLVKGSCKIFYENEVFDFSEGNLVIYTPGQKQKYILAGGSSSFWCHFTGSAVAEILSSASLSGGVYLIPLSKAVTDSFTEMIQRKNSPYGKKLCNASLLELIYNIEEAVKLPLKNETHSTIFPVLTYINLNYQKNLSLSFLSEKSGYSKGRFSHLFSEMTGTTPIKYQNEIRLKTASEMLIATNSTVTEIALSVGFSDPLYFSRLFKKYYGVSPANYRKKR